MPRKRKPFDFQAFEESTSIVPQAVAEGVVDKAARLFGLPIDYGDRYHTELAVFLVETLVRTIEHNPQFERRFHRKGRGGLDLLWAFMQHWLVSALNKEPVFRELRSYVLAVPRHVAEEFAMGR